MLSYRGAAVDADIIRCSGDVVDKVFDVVSREAGETLDYLCFGLERVRDCHVAVALDAGFIGDRDILAAFCCLNPKTMSDFCGCCKFRLPCLLCSDYPPAPELLLVMFYDAKLYNILYNAKYITLININNVANLTAGDTCLKPY